MEGESPTLRYYLCFVFETFHFKQICTPFYHVKRCYLINLMIGKESLNFLTRFYSHFMITTRVRFSQFEKKILVAEFGACRSSDWVNF